MGFKRDAKGLLPPRRGFTSAGRYTVLIGRGIVRIFDTWPETWRTRYDDRVLWRHSKGAKESAACEAQGGWTEPIELFPPGVHYLN